MALTTLTRLAASTLAAASLVVTASVANAGTATADTAGTSTSTTTTSSAPLDAATYEARIQRQVNEVRINHGLRPVRLVSCADQAAERWGSFLARTGDFFHQDLGSVLDRCNATYAGEILARGDAPPREIVQAWMHSEGHRHVMLSPKPRRLGVGAHWGNGMWVVAVDFLRY